MTGVRRWAFEGFFEAGRSGRKDSSHWSTVKGTDVTKHAKDDFALTVHTYEKASSFANGTFPACNWCEQVHAILFSRACLPLFLLIVSNSRKLGYFLVHNLHVLASHADCSHQPATQVHSASAAVNSLA